jgi:hypothetical protein
MLHAPVVDGQGETSRRHAQTCPSGAAWPRLIAVAPPAAQEEACGRTPPLPATPLPDCGDAPWGLRTCFSYWEEKWKEGRAERHLCRQQARDEERAKTEEEQEEEEEEEKEEEEEEEKPGHEKSKRKKRKRH